jgi:quercetin dioxygenase-like cupin family protein
VGFSSIRPSEHEWLTRPHGADEPARRVSELSERLGLRHERANVWRYEPHAKGLRHRHRDQDETFVVLRGTLSMYVGEPSERHDVPAGGVLHVTAGTPLQTVNHGEDDLVIYVHGYPPEDARAEVLESDVQA